MPGPFFLGLDISTTATKALLMDERGQVVSTAAAPHTLQAPQPLWSEQDPAEWWLATRSSIRSALLQAEVSGEQVVGIGLTGQMHGLVLLDASGAVLRPAILWNDQRTQAQCDEIHRRIGRERFISITGNVALTGFTAPKILWVQEHEPDTYAKAAHILLPKDYIRFKLTGEFAMDKADGSGTVLFDIGARDWSPSLLAELDITPNWLPTTFEGPDSTGRINKEAAEATGLAAGTPVVAGGGDQAAGAVGVGAVDPGIIALTLGTSGVVFASTDKPLIEAQGRLHAFCHAAPATWHLMGVMLSAAGSLQWYRDTLAPNIPFEQLIRESENVPAGAEGLLFLPYLSGERTPHPDPLARGAFIGLTLRHTRAHMTRAVLEGVAFGLKDIFQLILRSGLGEVRQVRASGGGVKSLQWRQILANVIGVELVTVSTTEGAALGAALLAAVGHGVWPTVKDACTSVTKVTGSTPPNPAETALYKKPYEIYRELYPAIMPSFNKMP